MQSLSTSVDDVPFTSRARQPRCWDGLDVALGLAVTVVALVAHPLHAVWDRPYWNDEAWVAVLTRLPWTRALTSSSSTPIGWVVLIKLVPGGGLQRARLVPLLFSIATASVAYVFARSFAWPSRWAARVAGVWVGSVVALVPISLLRNDLKQYSADALSALVLLLVVREVDHARGRWSVVWFGLASLIALPFSTASAFVSVACFAGLLASALSAHNAGRIRAVVVVGAVTALGLAAYLAAFVAPHVTPALRSFWNGSYLTGSPIQMLHESWTRLSRLGTFLMVPAFAFVAFFVIAIVFLARRHEYALAVTVPVLWLEMFVLGALRRYPFLDRRTSHFLLLSTIALIAIAVADAVTRLAHHHVGIAALVAIIAVSVVGVGVDRWWHNFGEPNEDVRSQTVYVAEHEQPGDVVLVNAHANWGFAYYWPHDHLVVLKAHEFANDFAARIPEPNIIYIAIRSTAAINDGLQQALERLRADGHGRTLYIIRSHLTIEERDAWDRALASTNVPTQLVATGPEPLVVVRSP